MTDSDFTIGFKQGQEHGIQIMQEKIEDIKAEILTRPTENPHHLWSVQDIIEVIDNHIGEVSRCK